MYSVEIKERRAVPVLLKHSGTHEARRLGPSVPSRSVDGAGSYVVVDSRHQAARARSPATRTRARLRACARLGAERPYRRRS